MGFCFPALAILQQHIYLQMILVTVKITTFGSIKLVSVIGCQQVCNSKGSPIVVSWCRDRLHNLFLFPLPLLFMFPRSLPFPFVSCFPLALHTFILYYVHWNLSPVRSNSMVSPHSLLFILELTQQKQTCRYKHLPHAGMHTVNTVLDRDVANKCVGGSTTKAMVLPTRLTVHTELTR